MVAYEVTKQAECLFMQSIELYGVVDRASFIERTNRPSAIRPGTERWRWRRKKSPSYIAGNILPGAQDNRTCADPARQDDPPVPPYESQEFTASLKAGKPYLYFHLS